MVDWFTCAFPATRRAYVEENELLSHIAAGNKGEVQMVGFDDREIVMALVGETRCYGSIEEIAQGRFDLSAYTLVFFPAQGGFVG